jgi:bacillithiol disulfide reductase
LKAGKQEMYDLLIVGSGPSGLAAALSAKTHGLSYIVLERGVIANTIYNYPIARPLFSTPDEVELERGALPAGSKPTREQVLSHYTHFVTSQRLNIQTDAEVRRVTRLVEGFLVETVSNQYHARTVLVAVGGFGRERRLGVPGETHERVSYHFIEPYPFASKEVLVVGGGNSSAEASLALAEVGARVTLSIRRASLDEPGQPYAQLSAARAPGAKIKPWVLAPLQEEVAEGRVKVITSSEVVEIFPKSVILRVAGGGSSDIVELQCDQVLALIGADPDTSLLESAGAEIADDGRPVYDPNTYETTVPGLYVAGHITREMHMKNAVKIARKTADIISSQVNQSRVVG